MQFKIILSYSSRKPIYYNTQTQYSKILCYIPTHYIGIPTHYVTRQQSASQHYYNKIRAVWIIIVIFYYALIFTVV